MYLNVPVCIGHAKYFEHKPNSKNALVSFIHYNLFLMKIRRTIFLNSFVRIVTRQ